MKYLFDPLPRVMKIKTKINKWGLIKLKSFCTTKDTTNKTKWQPSRGEKTFGKASTSKGLISKIYKELMQLNIKISSNAIKKMDGRSKKPFLQRRHTDG